MIKVCSFTIYKYFITWGQPSSSYKVSIREFCSYSVLFSTQQISLLKERIHSEKKEKGYPSISLRLHSFYPIDIISYFNCLIVLKGTFIVLCTIKHPEYCFVAILNKAFCIFASWLLSIKRLFEWTPGKKKYALGGNVLKVTYHRGRLDFFQKYFLPRTVQVYSWQLWIKTVPSLP